MKSDRIPAILLVASMSAGGYFVIASEADLGARRSGSIEPSAVDHTHPPGAQTPAGLWKGSIVRENGIEIVHNPENPIYGKDPLELTEEYVIGASGPGGEYTFVRPTKMLLGPKNNLYVVDIRDGNVKVFDDHGRFVRTIGKPGPGPGELLQPSGLCFSRNELGVYSAGGRKMTFYGPDGDFLREVHSGASFMSWEMDSKGNVYALVSVPAKNRKPGCALQKFDPDLKYVRTLAADDWREPGYLVVQMPKFSMWRDDGVIWGRPYDFADKYELTIFDDGGNLVRKIRRAGRPGRIPRSEIDYLKKTRRPFETWDDLPDRYAPFYDLQTDDKGNIIVKTRYTMAGQWRDYYDIFSPEGLFLARTTMTYARYRLWANERLHNVEEDDEGNLVIKVYRVRWSFEP